MGTFCHRCGGELPGDAVRGFCPTCGAPQLRFGSENLDSDDASTASTGALPPPRPRQIAWPIAMRSAALVAALTAVLFAAAFAVPYLGLPSLLLLFSASFLVVSLYRRWSPASVMSPIIGAKIGLSTGVFLSAGVAIALAVILLVARYRTHALAPFDAQWSAQIADLIARTKATSPVPPEAERQMAGTEFRAGSMLGGLGLFAVFLLAVSAGSGAFAGSIAVRAPSRE